jgi:hypothetical protein
LLDHIRQAVDDGQTVRLEWVFDADQLSSIGDAVAAGENSDPASIRSLQRQLSDQFSYQELELFVKCRSVLESAQQ